MNKQEVKPNEEKGQTYKKSVSHEKTRLIPRKLTD